MRASHVKGYDHGGQARRGPVDPLLTPDVVALLGRFTRERGRKGHANAHCVDRLASLARAAMCRNVRSMEYFEAPRASEAGAS